MSKPVIAITRPKDRAGKACEIVEKLGGKAILAPTLDLKPVNTQSLKDLVAKKDQLDWIIFTSPTTIVSLNKFYPGFIESLDCKIAVIGNKTGKLVEKQGVTVDLIPDDFTAEGIIDEFEKNNITNKTIDSKINKVLFIIFPLHTNKIINIDYNDYNDSKKNSEPEN